MGRKKCNNARYILSKSLNAELTALWGKITFKYFSPWYN